MQTIRAFWQYLGSHQSSRVRMLHLCLLLLVLSQIVISNFMHVPTAMHTPMHGSNWLFSWMHIGCGLFLLGLTAVLITVCWRSRGLRHYFPYLWGDVTQLRQDLHALRVRQLPGAQAGGLAACVQGLGLGAMVLVTLSGASWLLLWLTGQPWAAEVRALHQALTGLVETYLVGHGGMGVLHFWMQQRTSRS